MALSIEDLLLGTDDQLATPEKAAALAGALKGQRNYGLLGQLMNLEPTRNVGNALVGQADDALKLGVSRQEAGLRRAIDAENMRLERESNAIRRATEERRHEEMMGLRRAAAASAADTAASLNAQREATLLDKQEQARAKVEQGINAGNQILGSIAALRTHPGISSALGVGGFLARRVPRSEALDFASIEEQLTGQTFLQAFQMLKGGGPITDIEGRKATEAMSRLRTAQSPEQYARALDELEALIRDTMEMRAGEASRRGFDDLATPPAAPAAPSEATPAQPAYRYDAQGRRIR